MPFDSVAASFLFQLLSKRYIKGSIIATSNESYGEWGHVLGGESSPVKGKKKAGLFTVPAAPASDRTSGRVGARASSTEAY
jgi:IstB-like ATP binding protein